MITNNFQQLEPGSEIQLLEVDGSDFGAEVLRFHAHAIEPVKSESGEWSTPSITYDGKEYKPWPYEISGLAKQSNQAPRPTMAVSNINNTITALCLLFDNMYDAKVTITTTFAEYLNMPDQCTKSIWYIEEKTNENNSSVTFSLSSPADFGGLQIPSRVMTTMCEWALRGDYRKADCGYMGAAMFDEDNNPVTDPSKDRCGGTLSSCRKRYESVKQPLRFGGFPTVGLIRG